MSRRVEGKVAFLTGAARGQGRSHAVKLAEEGADIIAVDLCAPIDSVDYGLASEADLAATVKLVQETGRRIIATQADVRDQAAVTAAVDNGVASLGRLDIVVANAGILSSSPSAAMAEPTWQDMIDVNLTGVYHAAHAAIPHLIAGGRASVATVAGPPDMVPGVDRLAGYRQAAEEAGIADPGLVVHGDFSPMSGQHALGRYGNRQSWRRPAAAHCRRGRRGGVLIDRAPLAQGEGRRSSPVTGLSQATSRNFVKSESVDTTVRPCSRASAARCASGTRFPVGPMSQMISPSSCRWRGPGVGIQAAGRASHSSARCHASAAGAGGEYIRGLVTRRRYARMLGHGSPTYRGPRASSPSSQPRAASC